MIKATDKFTLNDVCHVITCGVAKRPEYVEEGIPFLSSKNVKENRFILDSYNHVSLEDHRALTKNNKPEKNDILYTRVGSFGEAAVVDFDFEFSVFVSLTLIKPDHSKVDNRYLMRYLNSEKVKFLAKQSTTGIGVQNLNVKVVREFPIPLPPLAEQCRIAAILDKADAIRRKQQQAIDLCDQFLKALFIDMFGDPATNPKGWEVKKLEEITHKITDGTHKTPVYMSEGVKFISAKNINKDASINWQDTKFISSEEHEFLFKRCNVEKGDVVLTKSGSLGTAAIINVDFDFSLFESLALIKPKSEILNVYLKQLLNLDAFKRIYDSSTKGVAIKHLHLKEIRSFPIVLPPLDLQNKFAEIVKKTEAKKAKMQKSLERLNDNFNALSQKAFKGEL